MNPPPPMDWFGVIVREWLSAVSKELRASRGDVMVFRAGLHGHMWCTTTPLPDNSSRSMDFDPKFNDPKLNNFSNELNA